MAKILKILTLPKDGKKLRLKSESMVLTDLAKPSYKRLWADMVRTMNAKDGIGLAAPQIGQPIRAVVINTKDGPVCMINPVLAKKSLSMEIAEEGCLSVPKVFGAVKRHKSLCCVFYDELGTEKKMEAKGLMARAIQHELDHLDGIIFIDKVIPNHKLQ